MKWLLLIMPMMASASELWLGSWSLHEDRTKNYNEVHYQLGYESNDYFIATYHNSNRDRTVFAGRSVEKYYAGPLSLGYSYGVISGYADKPMFFWFPKISYQYKRLGFDSHMIPGVVYQLQARYTISDDNRINDKATSDWALGYGYGTLGATLSLHHKSGLFVSASSESFDSSKVKDFLFEHKQILSPRELSAGYYYHATKNIHLFAAVIYSDMSYVELYRPHPLEENWPQLAGWPRNKFGVTIHKTDLNHITETTTWDKAQYKLGVRFGTPWTDGRIGLYSEIGVRSMRNPKSTITHDVPAYDISHLIPKYEKRGKYSKYNAYPVVEAGITWRF